MSDITIVKWGLANNEDSYIKKEVKLTSEELELIDLEIDKDKQLHSILRLIELRTKYRDALLKKLESLSDKK